MTPTECGEVLRGWLPEWFTDGVALTVIVICMVLLLI